ncbi:MAG: helix-turn-helix transcriptional regulator [Bacteroidota bacterium]|nr:helix-turn-helix transcriptional regulator [Bacteroidota bacterium]
MKLNKKIVAQNLRLFGYKRFGTMKKFAEALDMNPSTLYSGYLNGRSIPGPVLLVKLMDLGCNINWLLTGREMPSTTFNEIDKVKRLEEENARLRFALSYSDNSLTAFKEIEKINGTFAKTQ